MLTAVVALIGLSATPGWAAGPAACSVDDPRVTESSGLVVLDDGRRVVHNDSGDRARYLVLDGCRVVAEVRLTGVTARDWEDVALGPAPGTGAPSLWFADTGDNNAVRTQTSLVVTPLPAPGLRGTVSAPATVYPVVPPEPVDVETLVVDPAGGGPVLITKTPIGTATLLAPASPLVAGRTTRFEAVGSFTVSPTGTPGGPVTGIRALGAQVAVTGADLSRDGRTLVVRTYTDLYSWTVPVGPASPFGSRLGAAVRPVPATLALTARRQGEGIGLTPDGRSAVLVSEGRPAPVDMVAVPRPTTSNPAGAAPSPTSSAMPPAGTQPSAAASPAEATGRRVQLLGLGVAAALGLALVGLVRR